MELTDLIGSSTSLSSPDSSGAAITTATTPSATTDFTQLLGTAFNKLQDAGNAVFASVGGGGGGLASATAGANQVATGNVQALTAEAAAANKLKADNLEAANRFGLTPGAPSALVSAMSAQIAENEANIMQQGKDILAKVHTGFLDDPIQWLMNQVSLPFNIQERNEGVAQNHQMLATMAELAKRTEDQYRVNQGIDTADATEKLAGLSAVQFGQAKIAIGDAQFKSAQLGLQAASLKNAINQEQFQAVVQISNAQQSARRNDLDENGLLLKKEELGIQQENQAMNRIKLAMEQDRDKRNTEIQAVQLQETKLRLGKEEEQQAAMKYLQSRLDMTAATYGLSQIPWQAYNIMTDGPLKRLYDRGMSDPNVQAGRLDFDLVASLNTANNSGIPLNQSMNLLRSKLINEQSAIIKPLEYTWKGLDPVVQHTKLQQGLQEFVQKQFNNIAPSGNIFSPPPLAAVLAASPSITNGLLAKDLAPLAIADPMHVTDANEIMSAAVAKITKGEATPAQMAEEVYQIYNAAINQNNQLYQYHRFAMADMSERDGFNATVNTTGYWGGSQSINMVSRAALESYLTRSIIRNQSLDSRMENNPLFKQGTP